MKKLKLNLANMPNTKVLTREQLKKIMGGDVGSGGNKACEKDSDCGGAMVVYDSDGDGIPDKQKWDEMGRCRNNKCYWTAVF